MVYMFSFWDWPVEILPNNTMQSTCSSAVVIFSRVKSIYFPVELLLGVLHVPNYIVLGIKSLECVYVLYVSRLVRGEVLFVPEMG